MRPTRNDSSRSMLPVVLAACYWAGCGATVQGVTSTPPATPSAWKKVSPDFPRREGAVYRGLEGDALYCTLASNLPAAVEWLNVMTGKDVRQQDLGSLLKTTQLAFDATETIGEWELADLGWLVAVRLHQTTGGTFVWDSKSAEPVLSLPSGQTLHPMRVIAEAFEKRFSLTRLGPGGPAKPSKTDCATLNARDVLRHRSLLYGRARR